MRTSVAVGFLYELAVSPKMSVRSHLNNPKNFSLCRSMEQDTLDTFALSLKQHARLQTMHLVNVNLPHTLQTALCVRLNERRCFSASPCCCHIDARLLAPPGRFAARYLSQPTLRTPSSTSCGTRAGPRLFLGITVASLNSASPGYFNLAALYSHI